VHKLLFDNNISHKILSQLDGSFYGSTHVMLENLDEASDIEVWHFAKTNNYTIVTKDSDFNDLILLRGVPPKVIWLKIGNCKVSKIDMIFKKYKKSIKDFLDSENNAILEI